MASTYTPAELSGLGVALKENFTATTAYTIEITDKNILGQAYIFLSVLPSTPNPTQYFLGSTVVASNGGGVIVEPYKMGMVIYVSGTTTFSWTPAVNVTGADVYISATGAVGASIY